MAANPHPFSSRRSTSSSAVLVTGCSSGIGRAAVVRLLTTGRPVYATARRPETLADLEKAGATALALDVTDEATMLAAVERVEADHGAVGALVNNAGYGLQGPVEETSIGEVRRQFETNVFGLVRLTQLVLPGMRAQRSGRIVNVSSLGGRLVFPGGAFYHASKFSVEAISDALRLEVGGFGVRVSVIEPGPVLTAWVDTAVSTASEMPDPSGPYAEFRRRLAERVAGAYDGRTLNMASSADAVARVITRAVTSRVPRSRYPVGPVAHALITTRRLLPDVAFDRLMRTVYPTP